MAEGCEKRRWVRGAMLTAALSHGLVVGAPLDPMKLIPERFLPKAKPVVKTEAQKAHSTRCAIRLMGSCFGERS